jgi:hypothetical protein
MPRRENWNLLLIVGSIILTMVFLVIVAMGLRLRESTTELPIYGKLPVTNASPNTLTINDLRESAPKMRRFF